MTDRRRLANGVEDAAVLRNCLIAQARHAVEAGIDFIQIREQDLEAADLAAVVSAVVDLARGSRTFVLVNDRLDVAIACGARGVHLRSNSIPAAAVRRSAPPGFMIGQSVHRVDEAQAAASAVDYLIAGTIWPSRSKPPEHPLLELAGLARICAAVQVPVLAIGGLTADRVADVARARAAGAAGIGLFMSESQVESGGCRAQSLVAMVESMRRTFDTLGSAS